MDKNRFRYWIGLTVVTGAVLVTIILFFIPVPKENKEVLVASIASIIIMATIVVNWAFNHRDETNG